jgi:hypothetical protein
METRMETWVAQIKLGNRWEIRAVAQTKEALLKILDIYTGRARESGYQVRIVPYVLDEARAEEVR